MENKKWIRTCQECGNKQDSKQPPITQPAYDQWAEAKCTKCHSRGLDYGKWVDYSDNEK